MNDNEWMNQEHKNGKIQRQTKPQWKEYLFFLFPDTRHVSFLFYSYNYTWQHLCLFSSRLCFHFQPTNQPQQNNTLSTVNPSLTISSSFALNSYNGGWQLNHCKRCHSSKLLTRWKFDKFTQFNNVFIYVSLVFVSDTGIRLIWGVSVKHSYLRICLYSFSSFLL
jgi:hypothetical protein